MKELNFYSPDREQELGSKISASFEQSASLVSDLAINAYVQGLAQKIAQNSDARLPITVRILNRDEVQAFTVIGGHEYVTRGLLLRLQSEGELASILARGAAHVALRSAAREYTRVAMLQVANIPMIWETTNGTNGNPPLSLRAAGLVSPLGLLGWKRADEFDADYFGIQYLYKNGYDTNCFLSAIQALGLENRGDPRSEAVSPFPSVAERLRALQKEIDEMLPKRTGEVVSTPEFGEFQNHVRSLPPPEPEAPPRLVRPQAEPELIRHDSPLPN